MLGLRSCRANKKLLPYGVCEVETLYGKVRTKGAGKKHIQPGYEDCRRIAWERKVPLQEVYQEPLDNRKDRL
jgi:uncharacterized protein (DUF111 family)